ncbi:hypothetical protein B0J17DRAFT_631637 [Rhizoctonia solani]|nr:hypothetical protein B0J17DRAFT_631637 [Rhizoctonia solani]
MTKPARCATSRPSRYIPIFDLEVNTGSPYMEPTPASSTMHLNAIPRESHRNEIYSNYDSVTPREIMDPSPLPLYSNIPEQFFSHINPANSSGISQSVSGALHSYSMIISTSNSASQSLAGLDHYDSDEDHDSEGVRIPLCTAPNVDKNATANTLLYEK